MRAMRLGSMVIHEDYEGRILPVQFTWEIATLRRVWGAIV